MSAITTLFTIVLTWWIFGLWVGFGQTVSYNTNYVIITGAGSASQNGTYIYQSAVIAPYSTGCYTNLSANGATIGTYSGSIIMGDYYNAGTFPTTWTIDAGSAPAPTGSFLAVTNQWLTGLTNYWTLPGDQVFLTAGGWNSGVPGVSSNQVSVAFNNIAFFTSPWCSGGGLPWSINASLQWDGTNLNGNVVFASGDTNAPASSSIIQIPNFNPGTNTFGVILSTTNTLTLSSARLTAQRAPTNDLPQHVYTPTTPAYSTGNYYLSNTWNLAAITNPMPNKSHWVGDSNGIALVSLYLSNGVVFIKTLH